MFIALSEHDHSKAVAYMLVHSYPQIITVLDHIHTHTTTMYKLTQFSLTNERQLRKTKVNNGERCVP